MQELWLPLSDIPVHGREFYFEDDQDWLSIWAEIDPDYEIAGDMSAALNVYPQKHGIFINGFVKGRVGSPCFRCLEPGLVVIDHKFEIFETFDDNRQEQLGAGILKYDKGLWLINIRQVIREQLVLAMPDKILCIDDCLGLCLVCGGNMNSTTCGCLADTGDPRLNVLRKCKITY